MAELLMLKFEGSYEAERALSDVRALEGLPYAWLDDVAVVEKHRGGLVAFHSPHGSAVRGAVYGGLVGLLLFWWFPPAWFFGGWLGGMGGGALIGEAMKRSGVDERLVDQIKAALVPGTSALFFIGDSADADEIARAFQGHHPVSEIRHVMSEATLANIKRELGDSRSS